jgi:hypothetical protein
MAPFVECVVGTYLMFDGVSTFNLMFLSYDVGSGMIYFSLVGFHC